MDYSRRIDLFLQDSQESTGLQVIEYDDFRSALRFVEILSFFKYPFLPELVKWSYPSKDQTKFKVFIPSYTETNFSDLNSDEKTIIIELVSRQINFLGKYSIYIREDNLKFSNYKYKNIICPIIIPTNFTSSYSISLTREKAISLIKRNKLTQDNSQDKSKDYLPAYQEMCHILDGIENRFAANLNSLNPFNIVNNFALNKHSRIAMLSALKRSSIRSPKTASLLASLYISNIIGAPNPVKAITFCKIATDNKKIDKKISTEIDKTLNMAKKLKSYHMEMENEAQIRANAMKDKFKIIQKYKVGDIENQKERDGEYAVDRELKEILDKTESSLMEQAGKYLSIINTIKEPILKCAILGRAAIITGDYDMLMAAALAGDPLSQYHLIKRELSNSDQMHPSNLAKEMVNCCKYNYPRLAEFSKYLSQFRTY